MTEILELVIPLQVGHIPLEPFVCFGIWSGGFSDALQELVNLCKLILER